MIDAYSWHVAHADELRRLDPAMSRNNAVGAIRQDWTNETEFLNARRNLFDLLCSVRPWIPCPWLQLTGVFIRDLQCGHGSPRHRRRRPVTEQVKDPERRLRVMTKWGDIATPTVSGDPKPNEVRIGKLNGAFPCY